LIDLTKIFEQFNTLNVLIVGDVMLDAYYFGRVDRISPEAPVPIVAVNKKNKRPGGAANVAFNLHSLGATPHICSVVGNDLEGEWLRGFFKDNSLPNDGLVVDASRPTSVKTRIIGNGQQVLRVDEESCMEIDASIEAKLFAYVKAHIKSVDALIFQDYNKGVLTKSLIRKVTKLANENDVPTLVDPKKEKFLDYKGVRMFKPNRKEIIEGLKLDSELKNEDEIDAALKTLALKLNIDQILLTLSEAGVAIFDNGTTQFLPAFNRKIVDVSGAGDSVISVAALAVACKLPAGIVAALSNLAGGLVCESLGVTTINKEQLLREAMNANIA
jgi:rfaE bifunctional protein kinase chain/domain